jgi:hypothetical protein
METTARHALPLLIPGQAQKELFHNEALTIADMAMNPCVEQAPRADPPADASPGQCWIVGREPSGAWSGQADNIVMHTASGWRFLSPLPGYIVWNKESGLWLHWTGEAWSDCFPVAALRIGGDQVVGGRQPGIALPAGGASIDGEARTAIAAIVAALMSHGLIE